jgi:hypothetical protein
MCLMMYLGSNAELRLRKEDFVSVEVLTNDQATVREFLDERHQYFIGSHSGCSCGFPNRMEELDFDDVDDIQLHGGDDRTNDIASVVALFSIIDEALAQDSSCTIYPVWAGSESEGPKSDGRWNRSQLNPENFVVTEQFRYKIYADH